MATAHYAQFHPQRQHLLALGARWWLFRKALFVSLRSFPNRIAQGQQDRPYFPFSFEEDEEQMQEDDAIKSVRLPRIVLHQQTLLNNFSYGFASSLLRGAGALF